MSAPRTNVAIAERMDEWREKKATQESFSANDIAFCREVSAALRKEPPALPAEVEAVVDILKRIVTCGVKQYRFTYGSVEDACADAATLLLRYTQAPAPPADVEVVLAQLSAPLVVYPDDLPPRHNASNEPCDMLYGPCICGAWHRPADDDTERSEAATLLRRYAQAVAEKDAKLQAVEALEAHWGECAANTMLSAWAASADLRKILREEH